MGKKPKVAFFDFAGCEGDQLQIANLEEKILNLLDLVEIVSFREVMTEHSNDYDIAFVEGSITRPMDEERLKTIRAEAKKLIALGDCACNGGVNKLRNDWSVEDVEEEVYQGSEDVIKDNEFFNAYPTKAVDEIVDVDYYIRGCPVEGEQVFYFIKRLVSMPLESNKDVYFDITLKNIDVDERSLVSYNPNKCILCRRCANICQDVLGVDALGPVDRGWTTIISTPENIGFDANGCIQCGQCISVCPVNALYTKSPVEGLIEELKNSELSIAVDSVALASFVQNHRLLSDLDPSLAEKYVVAGLRKIGFRRVLQYDNYLHKSREEDEKADSAILASWCLPARNYFDVSSTSVLRSYEENSPWNLLIGEEGEGVCLLSPCIGLKEIERLGPVITSPELEELFNKMELDLGFLDPENGEYDGEVVDEGFEHPGVPSKKDTFNITDDLKNELAESDLSEGPIGVFPCLKGCVSGGGNYPTVDESDIQERVDWINNLRGVNL